MTYIFSAKPSLIFSLRHLRQASSNHSNDTKHDALAVIHVDSEKNIFPFAGIMKPGFGESNLMLKCMGNS